MAAVAVAEQGCESEPVWHAPSKDGPGRITDVATMWALVRASYFADESESLISTENLLN
jgi:hypothetical protein